ncbi:TPA: hypothetical protein ACH3X3_000533 [Trebouxia sp. C0006]
MPLLDGKSHILSTATPHSFRPDEQVFVLQTTGEIVSDFQRYTELHKLYRCKKWASITGKTGLTFAEAAKEEEKNRSLAEKFPPDVGDDAIHIVHHSPLRVEELVNSIQEKFNPYGKRAYEPGSKHSVSKVVVKAWLQEVAEQQEMVGSTLWVARPEIQQRYNLSAEVSQEVLDWLAAPPPPPVPIPTKGKRSSRVAAAPRPEKRMKMEVDLEPVPFTKRVSHPPYARGGYNSEEWVFDDEDDDDLPAEQSDFGGEEDPRHHHAAGIPDDGIRSLEEEEERFRPGTNKAVSLQVLKDAGVEGMSLGEIMEVSQSRGLKDWEPGAKRILQFALSNDAAFVRVRKGVYALRALAGNIGPVPHNTPKSSRPPLARGLDHRDSYREGSANSDMGSRASMRDDDIAQAEVVVESARQAVGELMRKIEQAEADVDSLMEQASQAETKNKSPFKRRSGLTDEEMGEMPDFSIPEAEQEFIGDPDDKKDQANHRKRLAQLEVQQQDKKDEWMRDQALRRGSADTKEVDTARLKLQEAQEDLDSTRADLVAAEKAAADAEKALQREYNRADLNSKRSREREDRERLRAIEREERDRRRMEAMHAKRFPIDDLELIAEQRHRSSYTSGSSSRFDVPIPPMQPAKQSDHVASMLYIADFLTQFTKVLAIQPITFQELSACLHPNTPANALLEPSTTAVAPRGAARPAAVGSVARGPATAAASNGVTAPVSNGAMSNGPMPNGAAKGADAITAAGGEALFELYRGLLQFLLQGSPSPIEYRWAVLNTAGTWPEILRRYVLSRSIASMPHRLVSARVSSAASVLATQTAHVLTQDQHLVLLRYLCDEALDTEALREALSQRVDGAEEVKKEMREDIAEDKRKLKELEIAEKEGRRLRREGESKKVKDEEDAGPSGPPDGNGLAPMDTQMSGLDERSNSRAGSLGLGEQEEEEPEWDLPPDLQEYSGNPSDRRAQLLFRQAQTAERQRLDGLRTRWLAETRRKNKARDAEKRAAAEAEKAKYREKNDTEDMLVKRQEAYEKELEKFTVRRNPLGMDRHHRCYWWGVAGQRGVIYVEDFAGRMGVMTQIEDLEAVAAALDRRGVRELALSTAIDKTYNSIALAMKRAASESTDPPKPPFGVAAPPQPPVLRQSSRQQQAVDPFSLAKEAQKAQPALLRAPSPATPQLVDGIEGSALAGAIDALLVTQQNADRAGIAGPTQGWGPWAAALSAAAQGQMEAAPASDSIGDVLLEVQRYVKARVIECEECIFTASGQADSPEEPEAAETARPWMKELPKIRKEDRCGYCHTCLNPHLKKPCKTRRDEMMALAAGPVTPLRERGEGDGQDGPSGDDQQERGETWEVTEPLGGTAAGNFGKLWRNIRERTVWRNDVTQAATASRVAYCTLLFADLAAPVIDVLNPDIVVKVPKGKRNKRR